MTAYRIRVWLLYKRDRQSLIDAIASEYPNDSRETIVRQVDGNLVNFYQLGLLVA
jgi:hypothetical protein